MRLKPGNTLFGGLANKSQTWELVCLYSEQGEEGTVVADIKKK